MNFKIYCVFMIILSLLKMQYGMIELLLLLRNRDLSAYPVAFRFRCLVSKRDVRDDGVHPFPLIPIFVSVPFCTLLSQIPVDQFPMDDLLSVPIPGIPFFIDAGRVDSFVSLHIV